MSSSCSPTLLRDVHSRRTERWVVALALSAAGLVPFLTSLPVLVSVVCTVVSILLVGAGFWQAGWMLGGDHRIVAVSWLSDGRWLLTDRRGRTAEGTLLGQSRVGCRAVWLRWDLAGERYFSGRSLLLASIDTPENELRRLIVRLRIEGYRPLGGRPGNVKHDTAAREISMA